MPASQIRFDYTGLDLFFERKFAHIEAAFDRESLRQYLTRENLPYKLLGWAARRVSISAMLGDVFGVGIFLEKLEALNDKDETAFAELLRIYEEHNVRKRFSDLLEREEQRARDKRRYFRSVRQYYEDGKNLDDAFVIIEGCVCAKERLSHESAFGRTINRENGGWLLCDFPPEGMCSKNSETWERVVYLRLDSRMEVLASNGIPFCSEIGWFPHCKFAGYVAQRHANENYDSLGVAFGGIWRPVSPLTAKEALYNFVTRESTLKENPIWKTGKSASRYHRAALHDEMDARIKLYYLIPSMYKVWTQGYKGIDPRLLKVLQELFGKYPDEASQELLRLYQDQILPRQ